MRPARIVGSLLPLVLLLAGCPHRPPPLDFGPRGRLTDPAVVLESLGARAQKVQSVRGEAKVKADTPRGSGSVQEFVAAQAPSLVRLESISFFGDPLAVLTSNGERFQLHEVEQGRFVDGPATPDNVSRLLPFVVDPDELVSLLLGQAPLLDDAQPFALDVDERDGVYVLSLVHELAREKIGLEPASLRPRWVELSNRAALSDYRAELSDYDEKSDLPKTVKLLGPDRTRVELHWKEREVNPALEQALFTQSPPEGAVQETQ